MDLKDLAPDEANVHFLLGRLYKGLHDKTNAIKHLTIALNLDAKVGKWCSYHPYLQWLTSIGGPPYQRGYRNS